MIKYLRIYRQFIKISIIIFINHRFNLLMGALANITWTAAQLISLQFLFERLPSFAGWEYGDLIILLALGQIYVYLSFMFYDINLDELPSKIMDGSFDQLLLKPVNIKFISSFQLVSIAQFFSAVVTIGPLLVYGFSLKHYPLINFLPALAILFLGVLILYFLRLAFAALAFWFEETTNMKMLVFNQTSDFNRVPVMVLPRPLQILLIYIIPIAFVSFFPTQILRGEADLLPIIATELLLLAIAIFLSKVLWDRGLRRYSGVS
jgi:ABC-2 type transport system permease protein